MIRRLRSEMAHIAAIVGYRLRPYDLLADRRRWFWQPRQPCGLPAVPNLEAMIQDVITSARRDRDAILAALTNVHYGYDLSQATGLRAGRVYILLAQLERAGLIRSRWDESFTPRRRYYARTDANPED